MNKDFTIDRRYLYMPELMKEMGYEPVRHGMWLERNSGLQKWIRCSVCNCRQHYTNKTNYCPNCGAKMDKEETND